MAKNFQKKDEYSFRINDEITYNEARVIYKEKHDEDSPNDFNKVMLVSQAKKIAYNYGLDLIEINRNAKPPILKIYEYSKYVWELKQADKKKRANVVNTKEVQLSANISTHDMETKVKQAKKFIEKGERVKLVLTMKGRELSRRDESSKSFYEFLNLMGDLISYETAPTNEGNKLITVLKRKK